MKKAPEDEATRRLVAEIKEIASQYAVEVARDRKTWPNSIKTRVLQVGALGYRWTEVARLTGIPYYTILNWTYRNRRIPAPEPTLPSSGQFQAVTVTDPDPKALALESPPADLSGRTISITVSGRIRIDGLNVGELLLVLKRVKH